jgi:hypothetical protein
MEEVFIQKRPYCVKSYFGGSLAKEKHCEQPAGMLYLSRLHQKLALVARKCSQVFVQPTKLRNIPSPKSFSITAGEVLWSLTARSRCLEGECIQVKSPNAVY